MWPTVAVPLRRANGETEPPSAGVHLMLRHGRTLIGLVGTVALTAGCGSTQDADTVASGPVSAPPSAITEESAEPASILPSASPSAAAASTVELEVPVAFSFTAPADWKREELITGSASRGFKIGIDRFVVFTELGPDTVDGWIQGLTSNARLTVSEPSVIELDGAPGLSVDVSLNEGEREAILFREGWGDWTVTPDRPNRVWAVEVAGEVVVIVTDAPAAAFDDWVVQVEEVLGTIDWSE